MRNHLLALIAALAAHGATAQATSNEQNAMLYLEAVAMPKKAAVCAKRFEQFSAQFETAFANWREANGKKIQDGEQFLRSAAVKENRDFKKDVEAITDQAAKLLSSATPSVMKENCDALLVAVGAV